MKQKQKRPDFCPSVQARMMEGDIRFLTERSELYQQGHRNTISNTANMQEEDILC